MKKIALVGCWLLAACSGAEGGTGAEPGTETLELGARGPAVARLTEYFSRRGYFENERLKSAFPDWRPLIGAGPKDPELFDEVLQAAVQVYQQRQGLEATGTVDAALLERIERPTCGVPESAETGVDKWAPHVMLGWRTQTSLTFSINNIPNPLGQLTGATAARNIELAFSTWGNLTGIAFTRRDGTSANIQVNFGTLDRRGGDLATTNPFNGAILFDTAENWDRFRNTDIYTVALHELGHSLGLDHSSIQTPRFPLMWPDLGNNETRDINGDDFDALAVSPYTRWFALPGRRALDIGSGNHQSDTGHGTTFIVSNETHQFGNQLYYQNPLANFAWEIIDGGGVRIDVAGRTPWVVTNDGQVYERANVTDSNPKGSLWFNRGNPAASDIGANSSGVVWIINKTRASNHGNQILRWDGGTTWTRIDGGARRIDVGPNGAPYVITDLGDIFFRTGVTSTNRLGTGWELIPNRPASMTDLAVDPSPRGVVWVAASGGAYQWNAQPVLFNSAGKEIAHSRSNWMRAAGSGGLARDISVAGYGRPLIADTSSNVSWRLPPQ